MPTDEEIVAARRLYEMLQKVGRADADDILEALTDDQLLMLATSTAMMLQRLKAEAIRRHDTVTHEQASTV